MMLLRRAASLLLPALVFAMANGAHADTGTYGFEEKLYVAVPLADIRTAPRANAPVKGQFPAGRDLTYLGKPGDDMLSKQCKDDARTDGGEWICVRPDYLTIGADPDDIYWLGWVRADALIRKAPARAAASAATAQAVTHRQPATIYAFNGGYIEPIGQRMHGVLKDSLAPGTGQEFYRRGEAYALYAGGREAGSVVTDIALDCAVAACPDSTMVRVFTAPGAAAVQSGIAIDARLKGSGLPSALPDARQTALLSDLAKHWVQASSWPAKEKATFLRDMRNLKLATTLRVGQLSGNGKRVLFANWVMGGSMSDAHYGNTDSYRSLLLIAEQQADGSYRPARGSGSVSDAGCAYFDHIDLDEDGTDELILRCDQLEGSYHYSIVRRSGGKWK
jgi:hypothetical protein